MNVLGVDLGTKCGACWNIGGKLNCETWKLATPKEVTEWGKSRALRRKDPRIERLCQRLSLLPMDVVVFEDVEFSTYTYQTQLWSSLRGAIWLCAKAKLVDCVPVSTLKRFATGHGGATKEMMRSAYDKIDNLPSAVDDNAVDAYFLWKWAQDHLKI
jgi:hypothetical protein